MSRSPAILLFVDDWLSDPKLRMVGLDARGLWIDMLAIMHKNGEPYGHLKVAGTSLGAKELARLFGESPRRVERLLIALRSADVFSMTPDGTIYSRRLVRDEEIRRKRAEGGIKSLENPKVPRPKENPEGPGKDTLEGYPSEGPSGGPYRYPSSSSSSSSPSPSPLSREEKSAGSPKKPANAASAHGGESAKNRTVVGEQEFWDSLQANPAYSHIALERERGKMRAWLELPENRNRKFTRKFALAWLNKIEAPLNGHGQPAPSGCPYVPAITYGRGKPKRCGLPGDPYCPEHRPKPKGQHTHDEFVGRQNGVSHPLSGEASATIAPARASQADCSGDFNEGSGDR